MGLLPLQGFLETGVASHRFTCSPGYISPCGRCFRSSSSKPAAWRDPGCVPSYGFAPLQGLLPKALPAISRCEHLLSFVAVRRIRSEGSDITLGLPFPRLGSAFRVSHPLCGFSLPRPCKFISPCKRPSAFPSGISPSQEPRQLFVGSCRLVVIPRLRTHHLAWWDRWRTLAQLSR